MLFHSFPRALLHLITTILLTPSLISPAAAQHGALSLLNVFGRQAQCDGTLCGWNQQLCCSAGSACHTDASNQAQCSSSGDAATTTVVGDGGYWQYYTTIYTETDLQTVTLVASSYVGATTPYVAPAAATASCVYALNESPCGSICCASNQYCYASGTCSAAADGGSSGYYSTYTAPGATPGVPLRPTSSALTLVTKTASPTTTIPFQTPVATGANITLTSAQAASGGLSGGAIAGIVIGVLLGLFILGLICFYCCLKGLLDGCLALFGLGGRRKQRTVEIDEYERRSHHASGGGGNRRTWYGASRPTRIERRENAGGTNWLGLAGGLAGLWALLGLKRRHDRRRDEKSEYSSDYYTSASSASSDDRRTKRSARR